MEWLKVNSLVGHEEVPVEVVQREDSPHKNVCLFMQGLLGYTLYQTHIETALVLLLFDPLVDLILQVVHVLLLRIGVELADPVDDPGGLFVDWLDHYVSQDAYRLCGCRGHAA